MMWPSGPPPPGWKPSPTGCLGAARPGDSRHHTAVDFPAERDSYVVAPLDGEVSGITGWDGEGQAVYLVTIRGTWILAPISPVVVVGQEVSEGQLLGRVVPYPRGSVMLHTELWRPGAAGRNKRPVWAVGEAMPPGLADPWVELEGGDAPPRRRWGWLLVAGIGGGAWWLSRGRKTAR